jgi:uncharacterized protein (TIGR00159 family)
MFQELFQIRTFVDLIVAMLDITIVTYLIYRVLILIRGTKAVPILLGLVLVIISFFISKDVYIGLSTLNWVLEKFIAAFILLIIVIFQDDIRRGLAEVGRSRVFAGITRSAAETHSIEEIVKACISLSKRRLGALIAIERKGDLREYVLEGIRIEARVSHELLYSLFNPANANPTHDGAVIVKTGKIAAAGCFLPLTANPRVVKSLGTRHRAAIGLSEETDAVICIVSEETGTISVAYQGNLARNFDANKLRETLQRLLSYGADEPKDAEKQTRWWFFLKALGLPIRDPAQKKTTK